MCNPSSRSARPILGPLLAITLLGLAGAARAQTGGSYRLTWNTLDAGGVSFMSSGAYRIAGTAGQSDAGTHTGGAYTLRAGFWTPQGTPVTGIEPPTPTPLGFAVYANVPNPFSSETRVTFALPSERHVTMDVFDVRGERVRTLLDDVRPAGRHDVLWNGRDAIGRVLPTGVYWVRTRAGEFSSSRRAVIVR